MQCTTQTLKAWRRWRLILKDAGLQKYHSLGTWVRVPKCGIALRQRVKELAIWAYSCLIIKSNSVTVKYPPNAIRVTKWANSSSRAVYSMGLRPFACWGCGFESRLGHGCLFLVSVMWCQIEVSATVWSLVQRSPTECGVSECDLGTSTLRRPRHTRPV
jgi:hypothetical protein